MTPFIDLLAPLLCLGVGSLVGYGLGLRRARAEPKSEREKRLSERADRWKALHDTMVKERDALLPLAVNRTVTNLPLPDAGTWEWVPLCSNVGHDAPFLVALEQAQKGMARHSAKGSLKVGFVLLLDRHGFRRLLKAEWTGLPVFDQHVWTRFDVGCQEYVVENLDQAFQNYRMKLSAKETAFLKGDTCDTGDLPISLRMYLSEWRQKGAGVRPEVRYVEVPVAVTQVRTVLSPDAVRDEIDDEAASLAARLEADPELAQRVVQFQSSPRRSP